MKLRKKVLIGVLIFLVVLLGGVAFLIGTTPGLHLVLNGAARWVQGLSIKQVEGGWRNLTVSGLRYEMPGVSVDAGTFHLAVDLNCLLHSSVCVNNIALKDVSVVVDSKKMTPAQEAPLEEESGGGDLSMPYPITLRYLGLHNANVKINNTTISLLDFTTGLQWQDRALTLNSTHIRSLLVALPKVVKVANEEVVQPKVQQPQPDEKSMLPEMPDFRLPIDIDVQEILVEQLRLTGDTDIAVSRLLLKAKTADRRLQLQTLNVDSNLGQLNGSGEATLADSWPVNFTLNGTANVDPVRGEKIKLDLSGAMRDELKLSLNLSGPVRAQLDAATQMAVAGLPLSLRLTSPQLRWPLNGTAQYQADNLDYQFKGKATDYAMSLRTTIKGDSVPPATIALDGKGNVEQFSLDKLRIGALQGNVDLTALLDWSKAISWRSELTLSGIDTTRQYPDWPAKLDGKIATRGSLYGGIWQVSVPQLQLKGNVKQNVISADGSLKGNSYNQWDIPGVHIVLGRNNLDVKGSLGDVLNLDATIDAPHLYNALPGLGGVAKGTIKARGTLQAPQLLADLNATGLRWQQLQIRRVTLDGDVYSSDQVAGKLQLRVEQLKQDALNISLLTLNVDGNEKAHKLKLNVQGEPVSGQLALNGSFDRRQQRWQVTFNNTRFDTPLSEWRLTRAMAIDYLNAKQTATIGPHCWQNTKASNAQLCVPEPVEAGASGHAHIQLNRFDLTMIKPFLPDETQLAGVFSGDARVNWTADGTLPTGTVSLRGNSVKVRQNMQGNTLPIDFSALNLNAALRNGRADLNWLIRIANNGQFDGNVQISDPQNRRTLSGNVNIRNISLAMLNPALMQGEKIKGNLNSSLRLGGSMKQPQIFGQLSLQGVDVDGNFMPVDLTAANLNLMFNGMSSTLNGLVQTTQGNINLNGNAYWSQLDNWHARIAAQGSRVRVTVPPMVRMDVSPDLVFEATPAAFSLDGSVDIPWARITVQKVPESATGVSSDEVLLDKNLQLKTAVIPINSNLVIHVGNDVRLSAFGLKAKLNGDLKVVQDRTGLGLNGQINIPSGRFHAYGQDLIVHKGELQFAGPPDQPYINFEAIRNPEATEDDVTAGLRVTGLADEPKVEVFSDPAMSQQEALSYLLRGQGLGSESDGNALTSALVGLGVAQSGQVVGKIGEAFGVSNLTLDTTGVGDSQQVQVSGYVLPGLQVKYGIGIFDSLATLTLRYRLMPKLYLEAVSGVDQALDLLCQFDF